MCNYSRVRVILAKKTKNKRFLNPESVTKKELMAEAKRLLTWKKLPSWEKEVLAEFVKSRGKTKDPDDWWDTPGSRGECAGHIASRRSVHAHRV